MEPLKLLEKIMMATDFSKHSKDALQMAILLAKAFHSEIALIHVVPEIRGLGIERDAIRRIAARKLKEMKTELKSKRIPISETVFRFGPPFERIIEHSEELDVNLIVLGSGKKGKKYPLGTSAERVMIHADIPVLAVKPGGPPIIKKIICPVDFSEASRRSLINAIHLSKTLGAHLTVLTVFESVLSHLFGPSWRPEESKETDRVQRYQENYDGFLRGFEFEKFTWKKVFRRGRPHEEILRAIREKGADLLVMGSQGKAGLSRLLMGSTTEKVVREMPCSVLTIKQESVIQFPLEKEVFNIETHFKKGKEHLSKGEMGEAISQFEYCLRRDVFFIPAWEGLAAAYRQMGKKKEANRSEEMVAHIRKQLWGQGDSPKMS